MKHTYNSKTGATIWAAFGMIFGAAILCNPSAWAQSGCFIDKNGTRACPVGPSPGGGSGNASPVPSGPSPEEIRQQRERLRLKAKAWSTDEALDYFDRKDWDNAIRSFEEALDRDPDDPDLNEWLKRAKAGKANARMPAIASPSRPAPSNDSKVVDTRGVPAVGADLLANVPELRDSPEADRIRKGYQALLNRDWAVTLAWWQDALNRDPDNAALKRSVDLAKWMVDRQKEVRPGPVTLFGAANASAKGGDYDRALKLLRELKTSNPAMTAPADRMSEEIQKRRANIQVPEPQDLELLFPSPYAAAITATTQANYSRALDLLNQVKRDNPSMARTTDIMIANIRLLAPMQLPDADDVKLLFPERAYAGPMSGSGLELLADGYNKKAQEVFNRIKQKMSRKAP